MNKMLLSFGTDKKDNWICLDVSVPAFTREELTFGEAKLILNVILDICNKKRLEREKLK